MEPWDCDVDGPFVYHFAIAFPAVVDLFPSYCEGRDVEESIRRLVDVTDITTSTTSGLDLFPSLVVGKTTYDVVEPISPCRPAQESMQTRKETARPPTCHGRRVSDLR